MLALPLLLAATGLAANPILTAADPHAAVIDKQVWIYPTGGPLPQAFFTWSSRDFVHWERHGPLLRFADIPWIDGDGVRNHGAWAPCIASKAGKYFFYYAVGPQGPTPSRIGVASGDSPGGPFKDSGQALLIGGNGFEAIDPMVFEDPADHAFYLYSGGSAGATLRIHRLGDDMISLAHEVKTAKPPQFTEGVFMHVRNGIYYLTYSHGNWQDATYSVHYCTARGPSGPWTYRGAILTSDKQHKGPGHHSIILLPGLNQWLICYHRWNNRSGNGPFHGARDTCIDRLEYTADGLIRPVVMTDSGFHL